MLTANVTSPSANVTSSKLLFTTSESTVNAEEFEEETAPPEEGGPFNPFPLGSDENPLMAESKPTKGLMSRETV